MSETLEQRAEAVLTQAITAARIRGGETRAIQIVADFARQVRHDVLEEAALAAWGARFGPPSFWGGERPKRWHLDEPCTPRDASMHDNGCVDALRAIRTLQQPNDEAARIEAQKEAGR